MFPKPEPTKRTRNRRRRRQADELRLAERAAQQADGYRCSDPDCPCHDRPGGRIETHHIRYRSQGGPDTIENLITLCETAHRRCHDGMTDEDGTRWSGYQVMARILEAHRGMIRWRWDEAYGWICARVDRSKTTEGRIMKNITVTLTQDELSQILACLGNGWGDGDWAEWLSDETKTAALLAGWDKLERANRGRKV